MNHHVVLNLSNHRIWCHACETEVYEHNNIPAFRYIFLQFGCVCGSAFLLFCMLNKALRVQCVDVI